MSAPACGSGACCNLQALVVSARSYSRSLLLIRLLLVLLLLHYRLMLGERELAPNPPSLAAAATFRAIQRARSCSSRERERGGSSGGQIFAEHKGLVCRASTKATNSSQQQPSEHNELAALENYIDRFIEYCFAEAAAAAEQRAGCPNKEGEIRSLKFLFSKPPLSNASAAADNTCGPNYY